MSVPEPAVAGGGDRRRARAAACVAATGVVLLAAVALLERGGSAPVRSLADSYENDVFPPFNEGGRLHAGAVYLSRLARRQAAAGDTYSSEVFPQYGAFMNGGDESGRGQSVLRRAQSDANRWMRQESRDWTGRGSAEYMDARVRGGPVSRVVGEQLAAARQAPAAGPAASLARAEAAARSLGGAQPRAATEPVRARGAAAAAGGEQLYIPDIYNDKIDPEEEMRKMMSEFSDIIAQITELEAQMECAAACANSTVNGTSLNSGTGTLDVTFDDANKNVSGGVLSPDDAASMACLEDCGIDMAILNSTYAVETSTTGRLNAILEAVGAEKTRMHALKLAYQQTAQAPQLARMAALPAPRAADKSRADKMKKFSDAWFGHDEAHAKALHGVMEAAGKRVNMVAAIDTAVVPREKLLKASGSKEGKEHSFTYQASLAKPDDAARAWKPPPPPHFASTHAVDKAAEQMASAAAREGSSRKDGEARAWQPPALPGATTASARDAGSAEAQKAAADAQPDAQARAWKPPPKPQFSAPVKDPAALSALLMEAAALRRAARARLAAKATAALQQPAGTLGNPFAQLATAPAPAALASQASSAPHAELHSRPAPARRQSLLQMGAGALETRRREGAAKLESWLGGRKAGARVNVANAKTELIDWTVDMSRLTGAGSLTLARKLVPPRDSVRHTYGG